MYVTVVNQGVVQTDEEVFLLSCDLFQDWFCDSPLGFAAAGWPALSGRGLQHWGRLQAAERQGS